MSEPAASFAVERAVPESVRSAVESVVDPEIPVLTIKDLGVLRDIRMEGTQVVVTITPTYSGCPAMVEIREAIEKALTEADTKDFRVKTSLAPAWTTDWMSEDGKRKLLEYGIAPPVDRGEGAAPTRSRKGREGFVGAAPPPRIVPCPQCRSENTRLVSEFGSTACKALYQCTECLEPFDHFKCH